MPTFSESHKQQLLRTISDAYEKGAIASTEEASTFVPFSRNIRDSEVQSKRYAAVISTYADLRAQSKDEDLGAVLGGVGDKISSSLDSVSTSIDSTVGRVGKKIGDRLDEIASHSTIRSDIHGSVLGGEIKNTLLTMVGQGSLGDALKTLLADCIPCDGRVTAGFQIDIAGNFKDLIESDIINRIRHLKDMLRLTSNKDVYNDICSLVNTLNFMCVPDLIRILSLLVFLLSRYSLKIGDISAVLMGLVRALFQPLVIDLRALFDQYAQLVMNVVDCIIDSLQFQIQKLNVRPEHIDAVKGSYEKFKDDISSLGDIKYTALNPSIKPGEADKYYAKKNIKEEKENPPTKTPKLTQDLDNASDQLEGARESITAGIEDLREMILEGRDVFEGLTEMLEQQISVFFGDWFIKTGEGVGFAEAKLRITRMIGLIKALINFRSLGNICDGKTFQAEQLDVFVNTYVSSNTRLKITVDRDGVSVTDGDSNLIGGIVDKIIAIEQQQAGGPIDGDAITDVISEARIRFDECLYNTDGDESEKIKKWISELTNA